MKFEYGNADFHAAILPISAIKVLENQVIVQLGIDQTSCKAKDRATTEEGKAAACCSPTVEVNKKSKINLSNLIAKDGNTCQPGGGCC